MKEETAADIMRRRRFRKSGHTLRIGVDDREFLDPPPNGPYVEAFRKHFANEASLRASEETEVRCVVDTRFERGLEIWEAVWVSPNPVFGPTTHRLVFDDTRDLIYVQREDGPFLIAGLSGMDQLALANAANRAGAGIATVTVQDDGLRISASHVVFSPDEVDHDTIWRLWNDAGPVHQVLRDAQYQASRRR